MSDAKSRRSERRDGQDASATVELAILLPVYMLLFVGVLTIGHLVLIRQEIVLAVRYQAWLGRDANAQAPARINNNFFPNFMAYTPPPPGGGYAKLGMAQQASTNGTFAVGMKDVTFGNNGYVDYSPCFGLRSGATANARNLAVDVLNDKAGGKAHLQLSVASGKFTYAPNWLAPFLGATMSVPATDCFVYLRRPVADHAERLVLHMTQNPDRNLEVTDRNPIEDYQGGSAFTISKDLAAAQTHRFFTAGAPDGKADDNLSLDAGFPNGGIPGSARDPNGTPNLWDTGFRLGGNQQAERAFFQRMLGY